MTQTSTPAVHSAEVEWHSGGNLPSSGRWSAYTDYRWQCSCGNRYGDVATLSINHQHYAHLAEVAKIANRAAA